MSILTGLSGLKASKLVKDALDRGNRLTSNQYPASCSRITSADQTAVDTVRILLVDEDKQLSRRISDQLNLEFDVVSARSSNEAWRKLRELHDSVNMLIFELRESRPGDLRILDSIRETYPQIGVIVMSDSQNVSLAVQLLRSGIHGFVSRTKTSASKYSALIHDWLRQQSLDFKLAQYVRLHHEVMRCMEVRTFLATDVQQSFELKSKEDPFLSQYTFYLYQKFIEKVAIRFNGEVHGTAGDGTMLCFEEPWDAVQAAISIVSRLPEFNRAENHLSRDFALRLGIHTGPVVLGEHAQVSGLFSKTLDIAGHIQKEAQPNQIEVSEETLSGIDNKQLFLPSMRVVNGIRVYYLAQPKSMDQTGNG
jgi:class 3 adenylate cyclase